MTYRKMVIPAIAGLGVALLQLIMIQVVTFVVSLIFPKLGALPSTQPAPFLLALGLTFSIGIYFAGWVALKLGWLKIAPKYMTRMETTVIGAYLPLLIAFLIYHPIQPVNPFFFISMITGIIGFFLPGATGK